MPIFFCHFSDGQRWLDDDLGLDFPDLEHAYLEVCTAIPRMAQDLLIKRLDPLAASYRIADAAGRVLMEVPFTDVLLPSQWRLAKARRRPHEGPRSKRARDDMALKSFRRMFDTVNAGCVLMTPEMHVVEMNEFGARHSHVDAEAIRGVSIFDIFADLRGEPKVNFGRFMSLAQAGVMSEVVDLPYLVQDGDGQTTNGWWNAKTWPIFDDDDHLLGFVEWAEPHTASTRGGITRVSVSRSKRR
ncbi:DUF6894 family protein [Lichenibacterium dinghuense]|uniref:DUF6894 family protein n=1 Tax=Lichenibacterium dinghuense TaxID=2895977 RepID=UPI001F2A785F|nr:hypothetical protein [Lichenibacterium sp. 6Y81]